MCFIYWMSNKPNRFCASKNFLKENDWNITGDFRKANLILLRTYVFIEKAELKSLKIKRKITAEKKKNARLIVWGCLPTINPEALKLEYKGITISDIPGIILRTQIMVGFPTETKQDFIKSMQILDDLAFDWIEVYKYSKRPWAALTIAENGSTLITITTALIIGIIIFHLHIVKKQAKRSDALIQSDIRP